jgi:NAD(P)-dependent dehydrogenase (short-subunit alcohol dehydrogenase family)
MSAYVTAKTALIRLTEVLAAEVKPHGIAVFAMEPGTVRTAMAEQLLASESARRWLPWFEQIFREGRDVTSDPAARLLLRLASGDGDAQSGHFFCIPAEDLGVLRTTTSLPS